MKESTKRTLKKIRNVVAVYYAIKIIVFTICTIYNVIVYGTDTVKRIYTIAFYHVKNFYKHIFHFRWKDAIQENVDSSLDASYVCMQQLYGTKFTDEVMSETYDRLDKTNLPFSRNRHSGE